MLTPICRFRTLRHLSVALDDVAGSSDPSQPQSQDCYPVGSSPPPGHAPSPECATSVAHRCRSLTPPASNRGRSRASGLVAGGERGPAGRPLSPSGAARAANQGWPSPVGRRDVGTVTVGLIADSRRGGVDPIRRGAEFLSGPRRRVKSLRDESSCPTSELRHGQ